MNRRTITLSMMTCVCLLTAAAVYAAQGLSMKCQAEPEKDPATGKAGEPCGFESRVIFGGMRMSEQATGYCRACKKFVYIRWKRGTPRPDPMGEVWDASTGQVLTIYACPQCKGPMLEIKGPNELKYCPVCNKPHFAVDKTKPKMAID